MNELLGWYGYEKLDSRDTQGLDLHHFASVSKHARRHLSTRLPSRHISPARPPIPSAHPPILPSALAPPPSIVPPPLRPPPHRPIRHTVRTTLTKLPLPTLVCPPPVAPTVQAPPLAPMEQHGEAEVPSSMPSSSSAASGSGEGNPPAAKVKRERPDSPQGVHVDATSSAPSARPEDSAGADSSADAEFASSGSPQSPATAYPVEPQPLLCSWCGRAAGNLPITAPSTTTTLSVRNGGSSSVTSTTTKAFCSEVCFTQCRRASFKRSKACDWCRHIRHTVAYVDFQDGETQLQFCSDKCLNQYKMNIFCKETQAHLAQLKAEASGVAAAAAAATGSGGGGPSLIITPDLWLRDCREGEEGEGGREEGEAESHEEDEEGDEEEAEGGVAAAEEEEPEGSPGRALLPHRQALSAEALSAGPRPPAKKASSKDRRRKKRRRRSEEDPSATPFQQMRLPPGAAPPRMQGPRKTPPPPRHPASGLVPPPPLPPPAFITPHLPPHLSSPHIPLHLLPPLPDAHFPRFLRPQSESLPPHVLPNSHSPHHHPPPPPPPPPRVPPLPLLPHQPPSLLPPVTMLVPYPIILPIPVPIPIPIPILGGALLKRIMEGRAKDGEASKEEGEKVRRCPLPAPPSPRRSSPPISPSPSHLEDPVPEAPVPRDRALPARKRSKGAGGPATEEDGPVVESKRKFVPA